MNYRCVTYVIGLYDLISSLVLWVVVFLMGFLVMENWINLNMRYIIAIPLMLFAVVMYSCYLSVVADLRLIRSTFKERDADSAIEKCRLWLILSWISLGGRLIAVILFTCRGLVLLARIDNYAKGIIKSIPRSDKIEGFLYLYFGGVMFGFALLRASYLFCVMKFKRQLKERLALTEITNSANRMTESMIYCCGTPQRISCNQNNISASPIINFNPITVSEANETAILPLCQIQSSRDTNSVDDLPNYEAVAFGTTTHLAPPSYDSVFKDTATAIKYC